MTNLLSADEKTPPEIIFFHGHIYTGTRHMEGRITLSGIVDYSAPKYVESFAVSSGKIVAVGSNAQIEKLKGPNTRMIDLRGHFVMPGFNDAHTHLASAGFEKLNVNLVGTKSLEEMLQRIAARAKTAGAGEWVLGEGWD
ncbi:MAG TPA: amidohydrolase family protein, partial [Candidatus Angelobacter sp.]